MCTNSAFPSRLPGITMTILYGGYDFEYEPCNLASYHSVSEVNVASIFSVWIPNLQATLSYPSSLCNGLQPFVYRMCLVQILARRSGWFSLVPSFPARKYWCSVPYKNIGSFRILPASCLIHSSPVSHSPLCWKAVKDKAFICVRLALYVCVGVAEEYIVIQSNPVITTSAYATPLLLRQIFRGTS